MTTLPCASPSAFNLLRAALVALAALVSGQAALGFFGLLQGTASGFLLGVIGIGGAIGAWRGGLLSPQPLLHARHRALEAALIAALFAGVGLRFFEASGNGQWFYDTISYHLHFAASWMHAGSLEIVPTVFGDAGPAYGPASVELVAHAFMAPLRSDYFANCAQLPFLCIGLLAIYVTARELGAPRAGGLSGALAFLLIPEVWTQSAMAMVDVSLASLFLATLPFLVRLWRDPNRSDLIFLAISHGLFAGSKSLAAPFSLPLLAIAIALLWRHRRLLPSAPLCGGYVLAIAAIFISTGGFWYLRNWFVAGNPIFPVEVSIGGLVLFPGVYDASMMRAWSKHVPIGDGSTLARMVGTVGWGFVAAGIGALALRWRKPELPLALALLAIAWLLVPYQRPRFLMPFDGVLAIGLATATATTVSRYSAPIGLALCALALASSVYSLPNFDRLILLVAAAVGAILPLAEKRLPTRPLLLLAALCLLAISASRLSSYREQYPGYGLHDGFERAWAWSFDHLSNETIAYAGSNLPFPLYGRNLSNRVTYANVALETGAKFHDFPVPKFVPNAEPAHYRAGANVNTWKRNLRNLGCTTLFVSKLYPIVQINIRSDAEGYPIERTWADSNPELFELIFKNDSVHIYSISWRSASPPPQSPISPARHSSWPNTYLSSSAS